MKVSLKIKKLQPFKTLVQYLLNRIKVEPTVVSRWKSKNGSVQKQSNLKTKTLPTRPVKAKRKHDITAAIDSNVSSAKKAGRSMVSNTKHFNRTEIGKK